MMLEGFDSGEPTPMTKEVWIEVLERARAHAGKPQGA